ncbi:MAG: hypothetical protein ACJ75J_06595 [Cytophagaceae bacterium]
MQNKFFEFIDKSNPEEVREVIFNTDEITSVEKCHLKGQTSLDPEGKDKYILAIYTRNNVLGKRSNCLVLSFETQELRDEAYGNMHSSLTPTRYEAQWYPV